MVFLVTYLTMTGFKTQANSKGTGCWYMYLKNVYLTFNGLGLGLGLRLCYRTT